MKRILVSILAICTLLFCSASNSYMQVLTSSGVNNNSAAYFTLPANPSENSEVVGNLSLAKITCYVTQNSNSFNNEEITLLNLNGKYLVRIINSDNQTLASYFKANANIDVFAPNVLLASKTFENTIINVNKQISIEVTFSIKYLNEVTTFANKDGSNIEVTENNNGYVATKTYEVYNNSNLAIANFVIEFTFNKKMA